MSHTWIQITNKFSYCQSTNACFNYFPNLVWINLNSLVDDKENIPQTVISAFDRVETLLGKKKKMLGFCCKELIHKEDT